MADISKREYRLAVGTAWGVLQTRVSPEDHWQAVGEHMVYAGDSLPLEPLTVERNAVSAEELGGVFTGDGYISARDCCVDRVTGARFISLIMWAYGRPIEARLTGASMYLLDDIRAGRIVYTEETK